MPKQFENAAVHAARRGAGFRSYVADKTASGASQVLTDATMFQNIPAGKQVVITFMYYGLESVADDCQFEVVPTDAVDGGGTPTTIMGHMHIYTPAGLGDSITQHRVLNPPCVLKYSDGHRSVTMRINANDSSAVVSCGFDGWLEPET